MTPIACDVSPPCEAPLRPGRVLSLLVVGSLSVLLGLSAVWKAEGWPLNHEGLTWTSRVRVYAEALSHGDPLPLWSPEGAAGLGEAMPLFYHKLFNLVAGICYLAVGSYKSSMCLSLFLFGMVGVVGLYRACRQFGLGFWPAVAVGSTFPHLNYAVTDWLVRGAVAEYAALALCTWVIWWSVRLLGERRFVVSIGPILLLVFLAHSVIAYYAAGVLAVGYVTFCLHHPGAVRATIRPALLAAGFFLLGVAPLLVLIVRAGAEANLSYFHIYTPTEQYQPLGKYLYDRHYHWGRAYDHYTVQLDTFYVLGCVVLALRLLTGRRRQGVGGEAGTGRPAALGPRLWFSLVAFALCFLLQTRLASPFYRHAPGASFVQFPWRLLCFLSPLLVCIFVGLSRRLAAAEARLATGIVLIVSLGTIGLNAGRAISYPFYPREEVEASRPASWQEYWPVRHDGGRRVGLRQPEIAEYAKRGAEVLEGSECLIREVRSGRYMEQIYEVRCAGPSVVALPVAFSGMESVRVEGGVGAERIRTYRTAEDPRVRFVAPPGEYRLRVGLPTAARAVRALLGS